jgi:pimeloyl-ACP methyl ester carboxylesterase
MHGLTRNSRDFEWIASHLAKTRRVISVDQRGRGRSDYDPVAKTTRRRSTSATCSSCWMNWDRAHDADRHVHGRTDGHDHGQHAARSASPASCINDIGPELDPGARRIKGYVGKGHEIRTWDDAVAQTREINEVAFPNYSDDEWLRFTRGLYREETACRCSPTTRRSPSRCWMRIRMPCRRTCGPCSRAWQRFPCCSYAALLTDLLAMDCVEKMQAIAPGMLVAQVPDRGHAPMLDEPVAVEAIEKFLASLDHA